MKKFLCFIICGLLCAFLAGCGCESKEETEAAIETQPDTAGNISDFVLSSSTQQEVLILEQGDADIVSLDGVDDEKMESVIWSSSNEKVAAVDDAGRVDAIAPGVADIVVKHGEQEISCAVKVIAKEQEEKTYSTAITANRSILDSNLKNGGGSKLPYCIKVNRQENCVTVYTYDENGEYTVPVRAMISSCGEDNGTITGEFSIYFRTEWNPLFGDVYGKYVSGFSGDYLFHSVPYYYSSSDSLKVDEYNQLGKSVSMGCVRMAVADTKWIYENCKEGTAVVVYDDDDPGPLGRPDSIRITDAENGWDPTDDDPDNPYNDKKPVISGAKDITISKGESLDLLSGITAVDTCSNDITDKIQIKGKVYTNKPGKYRISYIATDAMHRTDRADITVTVQ